MSALEMTTSKKVLDSTSMKFGEVKMFDNIYKPINPFFLDVKKIRISNEMFVGPKLEKYMSLINYEVDAGKIIPLYIRIPKKYKNLSRNDLFDNFEDSISFLGVFDGVWKILCDVRGISLDNDRYIKINNHNKLFKAEDFLDSFWEGRVIKIDKVYRVEQSYYLEVLFNENPWDYYDDVFFPYSHGGCCRII